jgi:hypothetical protein
MRRVTDLFILVGTKAPTQHEVSIQGIPLNSMEQYVISGGSSQVGQIRVALHLIAIRSKSHPLQ